jgi:hypothetical protein
MVEENCRGRRRSRRGSFQKGRFAAPGGPLALLLSAGAQALDFDNGAIH